MSSKTDPSDQVKFLVSCIRNTNNGRPDFTAVATELGIVTKAAAQKRYERMLKAHGVSSTGNSPAHSSAKKRGSNAAGNAASETPTKKGYPRKNAALVKAGSEDDDDGDVKPPRATKSGNRAKKTPKAVEDDESSALSDPPSSDGAMSFTAINAK